MRLLSLTLKSMRQRKAGVALTVFTVALSVFLLLGVERVRTDARLGFASTVSGTDLLVGARSGRAQRETCNGEHHRDSVARTQDDPGLEDPPDALGALAVPDVVGQPRHGRESLRPCDANSTALLRRSVRPPRL